MVGRSGAHRLERAQVDRYRSTGAQHHCLQVVASRRDIEDCIWLRASHAVAVADIKRAIAALPNTVRRNEAKKNFVLLTVM
jgi:hypothetical protein